MKKITKTSLWELRHEILLNSLYTSDFENTFGYTANSVQDFFDGYMSYLEELMDGDGVDDSDLFDVLSTYDNEENLWEYWNIYYTNPLDEDKE